MTRGSTLFRRSAGTALVAAAWALSPAAAGAAPGELPGASASPAASAYRFHEDHVLGTSLDATVMAADTAQARRALEAARSEIRRLDAVLSGHRADSELSALNANPADEAAVSHDLFAVLASAEQWRARTDGAFSGRLGGVLALWQAAARDGRSPAPQQLAEAAAAADGAAVRLDRDGQRIQRPAGLVFALDAIAKGYIVDAAVDAARRAEPGIRGLMLDIGGDVRCWGEAPRADGWQIGVADAAQPADNAAPAARLALQERSIASSGRGARDLRIGGEAFAHIVAPQDGQPMQRSASATVIAERTADADALATAFSVMPPEASLALADTLPGVAVLLQTADGRTFASRRWRAGTATASASAGRDAPRLWQTAASATAAAPWPKDYLATIAYEVPKIDAESYRAPYVTIWITDENKQLVRTLLVLGEKPKWIDSNYVWWRRYGRKMTGLDTIAKPTRQPGRYTLSWDGLNDDGQPAGQGKYLVHVEASREHGSHTYQSFDLELGTAALEKSLPAKEEMGALRLVYGKGS